MAEQLATVCFLELIFFFFFSVFLMKVTFFWLFYSHLLDHYLACVFIWPSYTFMKGVLLIKKGIKI